MDRQTRIHLIDDFRAYVVGLVVDHGQHVGDVARRIGIDTRLLGCWIKNFDGRNESSVDEVEALHQEIARLKEEQDTLLSTLCLLLTRIRSVPPKNTRSP